LLFLIVGLSYIWFPERVLNLGIFLRRFLPKGRGFDVTEMEPSVISFAGWAMLVVLVPVLAIFNP
jgi:hypothetical protein